MASEVKVDTSQFILALRAYKAATKKDAVDVLNRAAKNLVYRAASFTPKGRAAYVRRSLMKDPHLRFALTSIALKRKWIGTLKSPQFAKAVEAFVTHRAISAGYMRAGWAKAIEQLGGSFKGSKFRGARGFANKAQVNKLIVDIVNTTQHLKGASVQGAELIGSKALQQAISFVAADMIQYSKELMGLTAKKYSAR